MVTETRVYSQEAEQVVLGAILRNPQTLDDVAELISGPESFYSHAHSSIYQAIQALANKNVSIDPMTVSEELGKNLQGVGGRSYLIEIMDLVPSTSIAAMHARTILKYHTIRESIKAAEGILRKCAEAPDPEELLDFLESQLTQVSFKHHVHAESLIGEGLDELYAQMDKPDIGGVETKYPPIDRIIGKLKNSEVTIIAGRPSLGKTALCLNIAQNLAVDHQIPVAFISLEMTKQAMQKRIMAPLSEIPITSMDYQGMDEGRWRRFNQAGQKIASVPLHIVDPPSMTMFQIRSMARRMKLSYDIRLLIIDYLQLIVPQNHHKPLREQVTETSRLLKSLARELNIPVLVACQLSRKVEDRTNRWPELSDLRESGAIEQDASDVLLMYRPSYYLQAELSDPNHKGHEAAKEIDARGDAKIIVAKQRNGPTGVADLYFHPEICRFETFARNSTGEGL